MKIALISPKGTFGMQNPEFKKIWNKPHMYVYRQGWSGINPGILTIAGLTTYDHQVSIIDENITKINYDKDYDLVGISIMTQTSTRGYEIAEEFKKRGTKVVIGGIHATVLPDEAKEHADSVVIGEAEYLWPQLLNDFEYGQLKPFYKNDKIVDLKESPLPRYSSLSPGNYNILWIQTSRGCPHDCSFCAASKVYGKKFRFKSVEQIIREIKLIKNFHGNIRIGFCDDNLFVNKKNSRKLMDTLKKLQINWVTQSDISIAKDTELLKLIRKSGCEQILIGLESLSEQNLKYIDNDGWKAKKLKSYKEDIWRIQEQGIGVMGAFIIGFDNDNKQTLQDTIDFINENCMGSCQATILTPLPGTRLREKMEKENKILPLSWENYTLNDSIILHPTFTKEELEAELLNIYKSVFNRKMNEKRMQFFLKENEKLQKMRESVKIYT